MKQSKLLAIRSILLLSLALFSGVEGANLFSCLPNREVTSQEDYGIPIWSMQPAPPLADGNHDYKLNHFSDRPKGFTPRALVMHYTVCNWETTLRLFGELPDEVSAHYVISEEEGSVTPGGTVVRIVPEDKRAWHAGPSEWRDIVCDTRDGKSRGLNSSSIGIENVNKGFTDKDGVRAWYPFDSEQINALGLLSLGIVARWGIHPANVVGHSDICPGIKSDPGVLFPWGELYCRHGVGAWLTQDELLGCFSENVIEKEPLPQGVNEAYFLSKLREYGYTTVPEGAGVITPEIGPVISAFRMHFSANQRPDNLDGPLREIDMAWIHGLTTKYPRSNRYDVQENLE